MEQDLEMENIWRKFETLPAEARREVVDFIAFLQTRYPKSKRDQRTVLSRLSDEPFVGIWEKREDLQDSAAWVRDVRKREW